jgi:hypothetical protein
MRFAMSALSANRMAAGLLLLSALVSTTFAARAEDVEYSRIGRWSIVYTKLDYLSGCPAMALFEDETFFEMALFQWKERKGWRWAVSISNPKWKAWMAKKRQHDLRLVTTSAWRGTFSLFEDKTKLVFVDAPIEFMNSIVDAKSLEIFDENDRFLTSLDMTGSAAAIKAVMNCVREPPAQTVIRLPGWWTGKRPPMSMNYASQDFNAQEIFRIVAPSVYFIVAGTTREASIGSAVAVAADTALTNCHVIENQKLITVLDEAMTQPMKASVSNADRSMACTRFRRHRVRCFDGAGGGSCRDGSLRASSSLRLCG